MGLLGGAFDFGLNLLTGFNYQIAKNNASGGARFNWDARPVNHSDKQIEDGDQVLLAGRRWMIDDSPTGGNKHATGYIGWEWKDKVEVAKFYELPAEEVWDHKKAVIFTVKKTPDNTISLETSIGGYNRQLTNVGQWVTFQRSLSQRSYSTGWKPTSDGYALHFESHKPHTVRTDNSWVDNGLLRADGVQDNESIRFSLVKYIPPPAPFSWEARPKAIDGVQLEKGDRVTMTAGLAGEPDWYPLVPYHRSTGYHLTMDMRSKPEKSLVFTVRQNAADGGINFETVLEDQKLCMCAPESLDSSAGRVCLSKDPSPANASTGWEETDGAYRLYFKTHDRAAANGPLNIHIKTISNRPRIFKFERVAEQAKL